MNLVGDTMIYTIKEGSENNILAFNITVEDFSYLMSCNYDTMIMEMIKEAQLLKMINFPSSFLELIKEIIINDRDVSYLKEELTNSGIPLFSLIINLVNVHKTKYNNLLSMKNAEYIVIECNKDNFIKGLELAKYLNKKVIIEGRSISLNEYRKLLFNCDINSMDSYDIKISYQEQNHEITIRELYDISVIVDEVSKNIERYNLSPLEKIIYVYDVVKKREYKKSLDDDYASIDLDKILHCDCIVCAGYSNLFNAVLKNLGIKATALVSIITKHQRSLVYVEDSKYNICGAYVFDPTNDSRTNDRYIDNYNYFGLRLGDSEKDCPSDVFTVVNLSFDGLLELYGTEDEKQFISNIAVINIMEQMVNFVNIDYKEFNEGLLYYEFSYDCDRVKTVSNYNELVSKYRPKEIDADTFMMALYNTRMIEFYEGIVGEFDIDSVRDAVMNRGIFYSFNYSDKKELIDIVFDTIGVRDRINNSLYKLINCNGYDMERNKLKVRLLKVLRNDKNNK